MIPSSVSIFGFTLHAYGLTIGLGGVAAYWLVERIARRHQLPQSAVETLALWVLPSAFVGARVWHVVTDFWLYQNAWWEVFFVWQGGMSIVGAIMGGAVGVWLASRRLRPVVSSRMLADALVFGVPVAQAVGRLGNWVNQELYGLPTTLPWAVQIDPRHRLSGFETHATYHPLFLYELLLLGGFCAAAWWVEIKKPSLFGTGVYAASYVLFYAVIRFLLEFLRIEKTMFAGALSVNQVVLLVLGLAAVWWIVRSKRVWESR